MRTELETAEPESQPGTFGMMVELFRGGDVVVLSGAGLSTESGIPDYRGPSGLERRGQPMTYQAFTGSAAARQRYWARSHLGWRHIAGAAPNAGHRAVAALERHGLLRGIITQNVDGLHLAAGGRAVTELHGSLHRVVCLSCWRRTPRPALDERLRAANPAWPTRGGNGGAARGDGGRELPMREVSPPIGGDPPGDAAVNPDGDVALEETGGFAVVDCEQCGGVLKPDVVFFGENVPKPRVASCYDLVAGAAALVVLGSSLTVMSGFRYVRHAASLGIPVMIVNQGETRGDVLAAATIDAPLGVTLTTVVRELGLAD
ncbi:MAG TPA: Sir2 family NAD-dependent protein deacetylase [Streptosporangiaceae bacterium]